MSLITNLQKEILMVRYLIECMLECLETSVNREHKVNASTNSDDIKNTQLAVLDVIDVFAYSILVDIFNDVPYTEAIES